MLCNLIIGKFVPWKRAQFRVLESGLTDFHWAVLPVLSNCPFPTQLVHLCKKKKTLCNMCVQWHLLYIKHTRIIQFSLIKSAKLKYKIKLTFCSNLQLNSFLLHSQPCPGCSQSYNSYCFDCVDNIITDSCELAERHSDLFIYLWLSQCHSIKQY